MVSPQLHFHQMEITLFQDQGTKLLECGMHRQESLFQIHLKATQIGLPLLHSHLMESTLFQDQVMELSECGVQRQGSLFQIHLKAASQMSPLLPSHKTEKTLFQAHMRIPNNSEIMTLI